MAGRIIYLVFGTMLIVLTVGDAILTENTPREQHGNLVGVIGGVGLMIAATAFRGGVPQAGVPAAPHFQHPQAFPYPPVGAQGPSVQGYAGQPYHPGQTQ